MSDYRQQVKFYASQPANHNGSHQSNLDIEGYTPEKYQSDIQRLLNQLNTCSNELDEAEYGSQANDLLQRIKDCDAHFLKEQGFSLVAQILFTRHGECTILGDKRLGLNPNAAVSNTAMDNMENTKAYTKGIFLNSNSIPRIVVSPMLRAKQTASMVIPEGTKADLSVEAALSENSIVPSGTNITSLEDFQKQTQNNSFWTSPIKYLFFKVSLWIYGTASVFEMIKNKLSSTDKILKNYQQNSDTSLDSSGITPLADEKKIEVTKEVIANSVLHHQDTWLFGHDKNFRVFLENTFGKSEAFEYGETRRVYQIEGENGRKLFMPPYNFAIDQKTGKLKAHFKPHTTKMVENTWVSAKQLQQTEGSTARIIATPGLSPDKTQQMTELSLQEDMNEMPSKTDHYNGQTEHGYSNRPTF